MIRDFLVDNHLAQLNPPTCAQYRWLMLRTFLPVVVTCGLVVGLLWALPGVGTAIALGLGVAWMGRYVLFGALPHGVRRWQVLFVFAIACTAVGVAMYSSSTGGDLLDDPVRTALPAFVGFIAVSVFTDLVDRGHNEKQVEAALRRVGGGLAFPEGKVVWSLDPAGRVVRITALAGDDSVKSSVWDAPIRAVSLRRTGPLFEQELLVRSGDDADREWTHAFSFPSPNRYVASQWFEAFRDWMNEDKQRIVA